MMGGAAAGPPGVSGASGLPSVLALFGTILLLSHSIAAASGGVSLDEEIVVARFMRPSQQEARRFLTSGYDVASYLPATHLDIVTTASQYNRWRSLGFRVEITQEADQLVKRLSRRKRDAGQAYRDYDQLLTELRQIEQMYADIARLHDIGDSWGKQYALTNPDQYHRDDHDIWAIKVSDNVADEEDEPAVFYMGTHHAREPISLEVTMAVLYHVLDSYGVDPQITDSVDHMQIWFIPLVNPNGHRVVVEQEAVFWRKNIRDNNANGRRDIVGTSGRQPDGVDLNRNYGFQWGRIGASDDPEAPTYHGPGPMSEMEVLAVRDLLASHHFIAGISYHSYGELVLYPYGYDLHVVAPDAEPIGELSRQIAETIPRTEQQGEHYTSQAAWDYYPVMGALMDFAYGVHGIYCYTIELGTEFIPPTESIAGIAEDNIEAAITLLKRWRFATLTGRVTDGLTGSPIEAEIIIEGVDDKMMGMDDRFPDRAAYRYPYRSDPWFGRYYRLLAEGTYTVSYRADGYRAMTQSSVSISGDGQTLLDAGLQRSACPENSITESDIYEGVSGGSAFLFLRGTDVSRWEVTYKGSTTDVTKYKKVYRLPEIDSQHTELTITAHGHGLDGAPCSDTKTFAIDPGDPVCPTNDTAGTRMPAVRTGGNVSIPLSGTHVDTWEVSYNGYTVTLPGEQTSYYLTDLVESETAVVVTAKGFDPSLSACEDSLTVVLDFSGEMEDIAGDGAGSGGCFLATF